MVERPHIQLPRQQTGQQRVTGANELYHAICATKNQQRIHNEQYLRQSRRLAGRVEVEELLSAT